MIIDITPDDTLSLEYEHHWQDLVSWEDFLFIKTQQASYDKNAVGYERVGIFASFIKEDIQ